jgi:hypothetical protein
MFLEVSAFHSHTGAMNVLAWLLVSLISIDADQKLRSGEDPQTPERTVSPSFRPTSSLFDFTKFLRELRNEASRNSPSLRELRDQDAIKVLREQDDWVEVDVTSAEGIEFRGWLEKRQPSSFTRPERKVSIIQDKDPEEAALPIRSEKFRWFWESNWSERGEWGLPLGIQNIRLQQTGVTPQNERVSIPGFQFSSFSMGGFFRVAIFETYVHRFRSQLRLEGAYHWGIYQVRFASNFDPIEVAGDAYRLQTHRYHAQVWQDIRWMMSSSIAITPAVGLGYLYFESMPQLKKTSAGDVIFNRNSLWSGLAGFRLQFDWAEKVRLSSSAYLPWMSGVSESPESYAGSSEKTHLRRTSWMPFYQIEADYRWSPSWSTGIAFNTLGFKARHPGPTKRVDQIYETADLSFLNREVLLNLKFQF